MSGAPTAASIRREFWNRAQEADIARLRGADAAKTAAEDKRRRRQQRNLVQAARTRLGQLVRAR